MSLILDGTLGLSDVDGSASTPAIRGTDSNTGVFFATDIVGLATGGSERMRIDSSGNVGIGTSSPEVFSGFTTLQVQGTGTTTGGVFQTTTSDSSVKARFVTSSAGALLNVVTNHPMLFNTNNTERMRIDSTGNVGIGTASPTALLHVNGTARATSMSLNGVSIGDYNLYSGLVTRVVNGGGIGINSANASDNAYIYFGSGTSSGAQQSAAIGRIGGDVLSFFTASSERMRITSGGDILVAKTTADAATLGVELRANGRIFSTLAASTSANDTLDVYSTGAGAYRFYVQMDGKVNATNTTIAAISDQRLKENIQDIDVGLDALMALKPRKFDWKEGKGKNIKGDRGWIAQEFEQVFPEMIGTWKDPAPEGEEPYKSVAADLIPVLVKAIQEINAKVEAQAAEIALLKSK